MKPDGFPNSFLNFKSFAPTWLLYFTAGGQTRGPLKAALDSNFPVILRLCCRNSIFDTKYTKSIKKTQQGLLWTFPNSTLVGKTGNLKCNFFYLRLCTGCTSAKLETDPQELTLKSLLREDQRKPWNSRCGDHKNWDHGRKSGHKSLHHNLIPRQIPSSLITPMCANLLTDCFGITPVCCR